MIINAQSCSGKMADMIGQILIKLEFSEQIFEKSTKISNLMKIRPVVAQLFHPARRTDRHDEAKICFSQFLKAPKIWSSPLTKISPVCTGKLYKTVLILVNKQPATIFLYGSFETWFETTEQLTIQISDKHTNQVHDESNCEFLIFDFHKGLKMFKAYPKVLASNMNQYTYLFTYLLTYLIHRADCIM